MSNRISSRTPEGDGFRCSVCECEFTLPASLQQDACCPRCNSLAWKLTSEASDRKQDLSQRQREKVGMDANSVYEKAALAIQELVAEESKERPLPDEALKEELRKQGIAVSRRTVTKLRRSLRIPSSRRRRRAA